MQLHIVKQQKQKFKPHILFNLCYRLEHGFDSSSFHSDWKYSDFSISPYLEYLAILYFGYQGFTINKKNIFLGLTKLKASTILS